MNNGTKNRIILFTCLSITFSSQPGKQTFIPEITHQSNSCTHLDFPPNTILNQTQLSPNGKIIFCGLKEYPPPDAYNNTARGMFIDLEKFIIKKSIFYDDYYQATAFTPNGIDFSYPNPDEQGYYNTYSFFDKSHFEKNIKATSNTILAAHYLNSHRLLLQTKPTTIEIHPILSNQPIQTIQLNICKGEESSLRVKAVSQKNGTVFLSPTEFGYHTNEQGTIKIAQPLKKCVVAELTQPEFITNMRLTSDESHLITTSTDGIRIWDINNKKIAYHIKDENACMTAYNESTNELATFSQSTVTLWDLPSQRKKISIPLTKNCLRLITACEYLQGGNKLLCAMGIENRITIYTVSKIHNEKTKN